MCVCVCVCLHYIEGKEWNELGDTFIFAIFHTCNHIPLLVYNISSIEHSVNVLQTTFFIMIYKRKSHSNAQVTGDSFY